jgi:Tfp pilus assembly protein PilN
MRAVNLLPRDEARPHFDGNRIPLLGAAGGIALVMLAAFALAHSASKTGSDKHAEADGVRAQIARLPNPRTPTVPTSSIAQERSQRMVALSLALQSRVPLDKVLREVGLVLPQDAWLTGFKAAAPVTTVAPGGTFGSGGSTGSSTSSGDQGVTIEGATYSQDGVARVLSRLGLVPLLDHVQLTSSAVVTPSSSTSSEKKPAQTKRVVTFTITASVRTGPSS